jgi:23S rRNA pseudouridine2604 synthase
MRLNKFISETGRCSRREADELIAAGRVTRNGAVADLGTVVEDGDDIRIDGEAIGGARDRPRPVYIAFNKPVGVTSTTERSVEGNIIDAVDHPARIFPIGRLDKDSEGLILLTNDGDIVNEVLRAEHAHEKEYVVAVDRGITDDFVAQLARGVRIDPGSHPTGTTVMTRPCRVEKVAARAFRIVLVQGMNRQIRKMCEALGYQVVGLQRVRIMHVELGHLRPGRWRNLTDAEVAGLLPKEQERPAPSTTARSERSSERSEERIRRAAPPQQPRRPEPPRPKPKPIPFGQPGAPGGPPVGRGGRGRGR